MPWRPALERQLGKSVSGLMRRDGASWSIGRAGAGRRLNELETPPDVPKRPPYKFWDLKRARKSNSFPATMKVPWPR
ncbi:DUF3363 domain-containing protein [Croceibacterium selenioxidans]|uniref:DUF3363 domain-containing protein n=1 Tax=Croceibacterium selenioxidans TaxID=2838833 RepID=UPI00308404AB